MKRSMLITSMLALVFCVGCASGLADQIISESITMRSKIDKLESELQRLSMLLPEQNERISDCMALLDDAKLNMQTISAADERLRVVMSDPVTKVEEAIRQLQEMARGGREMGQSVATARGQANDLVYSTQRIQNTGQQIKAQSDIVKNVAGLLGFRMGGDEPPQPMVQAAPPDSSSGASSSGSLWPWLAGGATGAIVGGAAFGFRQVRNRTRPKPTPGAAADPNVGWSGQPAGPLPGPSAPQPWPSPPAGPPPNPGWSPSQGYAPAPQVGFGVQASLPGFQAGVWNGAQPVPARPGPWPHPPVAASYGVNGQGGAVASGSPFQQRAGMAVPGA